MSSQTYHVIAEPKLVKAAPGLVPDLVGVELGGTLEFRNHFPEFPYFEVKFDEPGPPNLTDKLTGTVDNPIVVHMPDTNAIFCYHIIYKKKHGHHLLDEGPCFARSCPGCSDGL